MTNFGIFLEKRNFLYSGRGSSAIYLILKSSNITNKFVILPANICYAAVYPVIYSGNKPIFVDVNNDGNISLKEILKKLGNKDNIGAAIIPHMYGNPCKNITQITRILKERKILVIEDCALAMGSELHGKVCGGFGDYSIFSFGYSKTLEIGNGGMIASKKDLTKIKILNDKLEIYKESYSEELSLFSQLYRVIRNNKENKLIKIIYKEAINCYKKDFLYRIDNKTKNIIDDKLKELESIIKLRKKNYKLYCKNIHENFIVKKYLFNKGAVPWRFNLLIDRNYKKEMIKFLLKKEILVSDWYPVVVNMFGEDKRNYPNAFKMEEKIINLPLIGIEEEEIIRICKAINEKSSNTTI